MTKKTIQSTSPLGKAKKEKLSVKKIIKDFQKKEHKNKSDKNEIFDDWVIADDKLSNIKISDWDGFIPKKERQVKGLSYKEVKTEVVFYLDKKELMSFSKYFEADVFAKIYKADKIIIKIKR